MGVDHECDETVEMRERRHSATASVEKIFLLAPGTFRRGAMLVNFTDQGLKGVKDVRNARQIVSCSTMLSPSIRQERTRSARHRRDDEREARQELCGTIAQRLNLEQELHRTASELCILGFEPRK